MKIGMATLPFLRLGGSGCWSDVLVHAEQIVRVVPRLDRGKPLGVAKIGPFNAVLVVLRYEVHVCAAGREGGTRVEKRSRPGDARCVLGRVAPARVEIDQERDIAVRVSRCIGRHAVDRAAKLGEGQLGFRGRKLARVLDKHVDKAVIEAGEECDFQ